MQSKVVYIYLYKYKHGTMEALNLDLDDNAL